MHIDAKKIVITGLLLIVWIGIMGVNSDAFPAQISATASFPADPNVMTATPTKAPMSADTLIKQVNSARVSHGLPALIIDPILMQTAQTTADIMAGGRMMGHIGDVRSRVMAAGYGAGDIPWATENFVVLPLGAESRVLPSWADDIHQIPMVNPNYRHVGAGVAVIDDSVYYVLHAAYTSNKIYEPGEPPKPGAVVKALFSNYIYAVETVTPRTDGKIIHVVKPGQTLWSIAVAYNTHIKDILQANNLPQSLEMVYEGQQLLIPVAVPVQNTPIPPTLTQMVVYTETPTRQAALVQTEPPTQTPTPEAAQNSVAGLPAGEDTATGIIEFSIGGAIAFGLILIIIGAFTGRKKERG